MYINREFSYKGSVVVGRRLNVHKVQNHFVFYMMIILYIVSLPRKDNAYRNPTLA